MPCLGNMGWLLCGSVLSCKHHRCAEMHSCERIKCFAFILCCKNLKPKFPAADAGHLLSEDLAIPQSPNSPTALNDDIHSYFLRKWRVYEKDVIKTWYAQFFYWEQCYSSILEQKSSPQKVSQCFLSVFIAVDAVITIQMHVLPLKEIPGVNSVMKQQPEKDFMS